MAYTKTTWNTGDVITAEKLNNMEDGITSAQAYTESESVRFSGSVTTEEYAGMYGAEIDCDLFDFPNQITVTFDGTEYTCERVAAGDNFAYGSVSSGAPDFSEYPFAILAGPHSLIVTETASTHQVEITATTKSVNQDLADLIPVMQLVSGITNSADAVAAYNAGKLLYFTYDDPKSFYIVTGINTENYMFVTIPDNGPNCSFEVDKIDIYYE